MDQLTQAYETLGVPPEIRTGDLRRHYRELVKRWHPDQFTDNREEHRVADEALTRINAAYQHILQHRARLGPLDDEEDLGSPPVTDDSRAESAPASPTTAGEGSAGHRSWAPWLLGAVVSLGVLGILIWRPFRQPAQTTDAPSVTESAVSNTAAPVPPKRPMAYLLRITADDFVVAIWHNGQRVPDGNRKLLAEIYGATMEEVNIVVSEGDWLVFNVVSNPLRWGGSSFFGVAGMLTSRKTMFASSLQDGRWTYEERLEHLPEFLAQRDVHGQPVLPPSPEWDQGRTKMQEITSSTWDGDPIWGLSHNTWIKFVATPLTNDVSAPAQ